MVDPERQLHLNAVELLRRPGAVRHIDIVVEPTAIGVEHEALGGDVRLTLDLEALNDGIAVRGTVGVPWSGVCRRCLAELSGVDSVDVEEIYQKAPIHPEAYLIEDGRLDLNPLVRETVLLTLADERLCRDDCAGLCPNCGVDRNETECSCERAVQDVRWAALDGLLLDTD